MITDQNLQQRRATHQRDYGKEAYKILDKILSFSGLKLGEEIDYRRVPIGEWHVHEIYTINHKQEQLPHIVLLHGFGGTSLTFIRIFQALSKEFHVHALDAFGVGHSSRGHFKKVATYQDARDYFIDAIEKWRETLGISTFTLAGHSFGGYIATCYTQKYWKRVSRLVLLSPVGASERTSQEVREELQRRSSKSIKGKMFMYFAEKAYNCHFRPSKIMGTWFVGEKFIERAVTARLKLEHEEKQIWREYFRHLSRLEPSSQTAFYIIFKWPLRPKFTIEAILNKLRFQGPIEFYYGQFDWMDRLGAVRMAHHFQNVSFEVIDNADHQLIFDNPDSVIHYLVADKAKQEQMMVDG